MDRGGVGFRAPATEGPGDPAALPLSGVCAARGCGVCFGTFCRIVARYLAALASSGLISAHETHRCKRQSLAVMGSTPARKGRSCT